MVAAPSRRGLRRHPDLKQAIAITAGEPAGIGPDLCLALAEQDIGDSVVVITDPDVLRNRAARLGIEFPKDLQIIPVDFPAADVCGEPSVKNVPALLESLSIAVDGCLQGKFAAMVTAPLQKSVISDAGTPFSGHTEFIAAATDTATPVMLLAADDMRVALASTHLPLRDVADAITTEGIRTVVTVLHTDLKSRFGIADPEIIVCGLNPHAGEGGHLGKEDDAIIAPAVRELAAQGMRVRGPIPADTAFTPAAGSRDAVVAMYHDQGLPVLKYAGFGHAVNVTLGLPIIRTSVDHGTALDVAGTGQADPGSLLAAIELAAAMATQ